MAGNLAIHENTQFSVQLKTESLKNYPLGTWQCSYKSFSIFQKFHTLIEPNIDQQPYVFMLNIVYIWSTTSNKVTHRI